MPPKGDATKLREEGNALYKRQQFEKAAHKYRQAYEANARDPAPLRALSSALFELGEYKVCLDILAGVLLVEQDDSKLPALRLRQRKCNFYLKNWDAVINGSEDVTGEEKRLVDAAKLNLEVEKAKTIGWKEILDFPRSRPSVGGGKIKEYYPRGHDDPEAAYTDVELRKMKKKSGHIDLSLMYGGVGDGRHFFPQLNHIESYLSKLPKKTEKVAGPKDSFSLVLQDLKEHAIARLLIELRIMLEMAKLDESDLQYTEWEATLSYIFCADIMPPWAYAKLRSVMKKLLQEPLPKDRNADMTFGIPRVFVPTSSVGPVKAVFEAWLKDSEGILAIHNVDAFLKEKLSQSRNTTEEYQSTEAFLDSVGDVWIFEHCRFVPPPMSLWRKEPALGDALRQFMLTFFMQRNALPSTYGPLMNHVKKHWRRNVTLLADDEWYSWRDGTPRMTNSPELSIPINTAVEFSYNRTTNFDSALAKRREASKSQFGGPSGLLQQFGVCFTLAKNAITSDKAYFKIVLEVGDINYQTDEIHLNPAKQQSFDAIFMSNVPDYTGGQLSFLLYGLPILKETNPASYVQSNFLLYPGYFKEGYPHTLAEFLCLPNARAAEQLLGLSFQNTENLEEVNQKHREDPENRPLWGVLLFSHRWELPSKNKFVLPDKTNFLRWLAMIFFKTLLPSVRDYLGDYPGFRMTDKNWHIEQPHTVYTFVRLCKHLIENRGIPSHWVASFLDSILTSGGKLTTSAKPADTAPVRVADAIDPYKSSVDYPPPRSQVYDISPCLPELRAVLAMFFNANMLPCPLTTASLLPRYSSLKRYTMNANVYPPDISAYFQILSLVFFDRKRVQAEAGDGLYAKSWLRDQLANGSQKDKTLEIGKHCVMLSCFKWTYIKTNWIEPMPGRRVGSRLGRAEWVMDEEDMRRMREGNWAAGLVRTDDYTFISDEFRLDVIEEVEDAMAGLRIT